MNRQVFAGIKIADFTWAGVGPIMARYLGNHGATVVKVESATRPCIVRVAPPYKDNIPGLNRSAYFANFNSDKLGLGLKLDHPLGQKVAHRLVAWADVVMESFRPGIMAGWGLGYKEISQINPRVIMVSTTNLGQAGPEASHPGYGTQLVSLAGFTHLTGWPDREPAQPYAAYTDMVSPRFGASALVAALDYRERTGQGQYLDLSQLEASLHMLAPLFLDYSANGREASRQGNRDPEAAPHGAYRCRGLDRWCAISVETEEEWQRLCQAMGLPDWSREPRFAILAQRKENEDELDKLVEAWTLNFSAEELMACLQGVGVPAGVVKNAQDLFEDPQLQFRQHFQVLGHSEIGPHTYDGPPFHLSETPSRMQRGAPLLGEHTEYVLKELLSFSEEEYVELLLSGVLE